MPLKLVRQVQFPARSCQILDSQYFGMFSNSGWVQRNILLAVWHWLATSTEFTMKVALGTSKRK